MDRGDRAAMLAVEVLFSPASRQMESVRVCLPPGSTLRDALAASGLAERHRLNGDDVALGIWGRRCVPSQALCDGDRIEIYRALLVDPKEARRQRYLAQAKKKRPAVAGR